ncbi:WXG100 family type VII secretion target [Streptomyces sp. NPDC060028]|uniref:WXG100 family type VII secretion target n=1 Tax=Streptomyces sp. NPDC060028 TaxID=3347041 RepID=UPI00368818DC
MADIDINHNALAEANEDMKAAAKQMHSNLEMLVTELSTVKDKFKGAAAAAFQDFVTTVHQLDTAMSQEFDTGADKLADMHLTIRNADKRSAALFPGGRT